jgi:hypothetical protein
MNVGTAFEETAMRGERVIFKTVVGVQFETSGQRRRTLL